MKATMLPRYLLGSRQAILELAASPWTLLIGAIFVLSAGFAREYDGEDLIHEPWHASRPLGASLASGTTLFLVVHLAALLKRGRGEGQQPSFFKAWRTFLGLFWLTAPMAWLYAVPYERFMSPVDAIELNLWTLALVSVWRVLLMTRVISVLYGFGAISSFFLVMLFADAVVFAVVTLVPTPVIDVMGGLRHSDRDALISGVTLTVIYLSVVTAPVWIVGALISVAVLKPKWPDLEMFVTRHRSRGLLALAVASVIAFVPLLVISQPEQINRREVESLLRRDRVAEAFSLMSARSPGDYPPHWNPPPKIGYLESDPDLQLVRETMSDQWPADWVAAIYLDKIDRDFRVKVMPPWVRSSWAETVGYLMDTDSIYDVDPGVLMTAQFLLNHQPDMNDEDRAALQVLADFAVAEGFDEMPEELLAVQLVWAVAADDLDKARLILETGLSPDTRSLSKIGQSTALMEAASRDNAEAITMLLDAGADIEAGGAERLVSPAHAAAFSGSTRALSILLDRGADPHVGSDSLGSLIFAAAIEGHRETVEMLLGRELGIDLQAGRASHGLTPLHVAYRNGDQEMVRLLIEAGADENVRSTDGRLPHEHGP